MLCFINPFYCWFLCSIWIQVSGFEDKHPWSTIATHLEVSAEEARSLLYQKAGQTSFTIDLNKLRSIFEKVPENATNLMPYQKAYLCFLVGCLLFAKTTEGISPIYLPLLGESVNNYAWGAATLHSLSMAWYQWRKILSIIEPQASLVLGMFWW